MKEMKYQQAGDYEFPLLKGEESLPNLSRFGRMYLKHLKENYKAHYLALLAENKLNDELLSMDQQMNDRYDVLVKQFMEERNINEELKEKDQMKWVQKMNSIRNAAEERIIKEMIEVG
ncbi:MAG: TnpV protein [Thomasclavelia sp.]